MRIRKTGLAVKAPLDPPRMIDGVVTSSYDKVETFNVVRVDELMAWCRANPDVTVDSLATQLEVGVFA